MNIDDDKYDFNGMATKNNIRLFIDPKMEKLCSIGPVIRRYRYKNKEIKLHSVTEINIINISVGDDFRTTKNLESG